VYYQDDGKHFGNRLREARLGAGLSQSELEALSGIPKARLSRYETGPVEPPIQTLARPARWSNALEACAIVDTPGTNAIVRRHEQLTREFVPRASWPPASSSWCW